MKKSFDPTLLLLLVFAIGLVIVMPSIIGSINANSTYVVSKSQLQYTKYDESVSDIAMCNLSSEVYIGLAGNVMTMFMEVEDNKVSGWRKISSQAKDSGFEWALWQNKYDETTYALAFAGTDQFKDALQYVDMELNENRASQMQEAVEVTKEVSSMIESENEGASVKNFYLTGHSLGGYLAMYIASELVDSLSILSTSQLTIADVGLDNISGLHCVTFGAPGMYLNGTFPNVELTSWEKIKSENNRQQLYTQIIKNYVNDLDPVGTLLPDYLSHLGRRVDLFVKKSPTSTIFRFMKSSDSLVLYAVGFTPSLYYHMPWVYISNINNIL